LYNKTRKQFYSKKRASNTNHTEDICYRHNALAILKVKNNIHDIYPTPHPIKAALCTDCEYITSDPIGNAGFCCFDTVHLEASTSAFNNEAVPTGFVKHKAA
jgi:hypothetical protein